MDAFGVCAESHDRGTLEWARLGHPDFDWQLGATDGGGTAGDNLPVEGLVKQDEEGAVQEWRGT